MLQVDVSLSRHIRRRVSGGTLFLPCVLLTLFLKYSSAIEAGTEATKIKRTVASAKAYASDITLD